MRPFKITNYELDKTNANEIRWQNYLYIHFLRNNYSFDEKLHHVYSPTVPPIRQRHLLQITFHMNNPWLQLYWHWFCYLSRVFNCKYLAGTTQKSNEAIFFATFLRSETSSTKILLSLLFQSRSDVGTVFSVLWRKTSEVSFGEPFLLKCDLETSFSQSRGLRFTWLLA